MNIRRVAFSMRRTRWIGADRPSSTTTTSGSKWFPGQPDRFPSPTGPVELRTGHSRLALHPVDLLILGCPLGTKYIGGEHDAWCNLNKLAHRQILLSGLNIEVRSSVARAAAPHFDAVTGERSPSIFTVISARGNTSPCPFATAAKTVRSRHVAQYFPSGNDDDIVLNRVSGLLFDQEPIAVLRVRNPLGDLDSDAISRLERSKRDSADRSGPNILLF